MSFVGAVIGALLLLVLPAAAFAAIVPVLIGLALLLVLFGPWLQMKAAAEHADAGDARRHPRRLLLLQAGMLLAGMYGGYFGAAQGVLMMGLMSVLTTEPLQSLNGFKNVLGTIVNAVAAVDVHGRGVGQDRVARRGDPGGRGRWPAATSGRGSGAASPRGCCAPSSCSSASSRSPRWSSSAERG